MKIAVQMFGHLRTYEQCYRELHEKLLSKYDCDVFMHTWATLNHNTQAWHKNNKHSDICTLSRKEELIKIYNLKSLKIEEQYQEDLGTFSALGSKVSIFGAKSMFHSMSEANKLRQSYEKENNINYDFILAIRPDILLKTNFNIDDYLFNLNRKEINQSFFTAGSTQRALYSYFPSLAATDVLFFAKPSIFDALYENQNKILSYFTKDENVPFGPERYFIKAVEDIGATPILIKFLYNKEFEIVRFYDAKSLRKALIKLRIRKNFIKLHLLKNLRKTLFRIQIDITSSFQIDLCMGNVYYEKPIEKTIKRKENKNA